MKTSSNPNILVAAGAMSLADTNFLQDLYADGLQGYYDAISVHPYQLQFQHQPTPTSCADITSNRSRLIATTQDPAVPSSNSLFNFKGGVEAVHSVMQQHSDNSQLWLTEFGFDSCSPAPDDLKTATGQADNTKDWSAMCATWGFQANWLAASFKIAAQWPFVNVAVMYQARDGLSGESEFDLDTWGVLRHDFSPKLSYTSVSNAWTCLANNTC